MAEWAWTEQEEEQARFLQHLKWASEVVATWPEWKRAIWHKPVVQEPEMPREETSAELVGRHIRRAFWERCSLTFSYPMWS